MNSTSRQTHFRDPCIHCATAMEDVEPGACPGDPEKAVVIGWASLGARWDGVVRFRYRLSTNEVREVHRHASEHAPYYHFGRREFGKPPPYDARLKVTHLPSPPASVISPPTAADAMSAPDTKPQSPQTGEEAER